MPHRLTAGGAGRKPTNQNRPVRPQHNLGRGSLRPAGLYPWRGKVQVTPSQRNGASEYQPSKRSVKDTSSQLESLLALPPVSAPAFAQLDRADLDRADFEANAAPPVYYPPTTNRG